MTGRSAIKKKFVAFIDSEPEWAMPAFGRWLERIKAGESSVASAQQWRDERAAAEAAHNAETT